MLTYVAQSLLIIQAPPELAALLVAELDAVTARKTRSSILDLIVSGAETAAVVVALAQGPKTILDLSATIASWLSDRTDPNKVEIRSGDNLRTSLVGATDEELAELQNLISSLLED